jgi:hypothetical protein
VPDNWSAVNNLISEWKQSRLSKQDGQEQAQEKPQPVEQQVEIVAGGGEDGIDSIALLGAR